jgi:hypothetical protein
MPDPVGACNAFACPRHCWTEKMGG